MALESLLHATSPPRTLNLAGPEILRVRDVARRFGELFGSPVRWEGEESPDALLSDGRAAYELLGRPQVAVESMIRWTADWVRGEGPTLEKPTHFQVRDGTF
jgi:nucleoside-diphosphate-sugar epimerase